MVPSNRNQLLATYNCSGSAAECLILGTIPSCGYLILSFLVKFVAVDGKIVLGLLDCTNSMLLIVVMFFSSVV